MGNPRRRNVPGALLALVLLSLPGSGRAATVFGTVAEAPQFIPLAGTHVYLEGKRPQIDSQLTDSAGAYRFEGVTGCELGCEVRASRDGFWTKASDGFILDADRSLNVDIDLERIHALTVRVVKAEDTSQPVLNAQAVLWSSSGELPRCAKADSAARMRFRDLQTFTGYLLTVSAPGREATSSTLHFHDPVSEGFSRILLRPDTARSDKAVHGSLTVQGQGPAAGENVVLSCRNAEVVADLFGTAGTDGRYAIEGVPAACDSALLYAGADSTAIALAGSDNAFDWAAKFPEPDGIRPPAARRIRTVPPGLPWNGYDLAGRKLGAGSVKARSFLPLRRPR
jgi:hypothetical protein